MEYHKNYSDAMLAPSEGTIVDNKLTPEDCDNIYTCMEHVSDMSVVDKIFSENISNKYPRRKYNDDIGDNTDNYSIDDIDSINLMRMKNNTDDINEKLSNGIFDEPSDDPIVLYEMLDCLNFSKQESGDFDTESERRSYKQWIQQIKLDNEEASAISKGKGEFF